MVCLSWDYDAAFSRQYELKLICILLVNGIGISMIGVSFTQSCFKVKDTEKVIAKVEELMTF